MFRLLTRLVKIFQVLVWIRMLLAAVVPECRALMLV
jgi:hypothetical protein